MTENTKANCFRKARLVEKMSQRRLKKKLSIHHQTWDNGRSMTFEEYVAMDEEGGSVVGTVGLRHFSGSVNKEDRKFVLCRGGPR